MSTYVFIRDAAITFVVRAEIKAESEEAARAKANAMTRAQWADLDETVDGSQADVLGPIELDYLVPDQPE